MSKSTIVTVSDAIDKADSASSNALRRSWSFPAFLTSIALFLTSFFKRQPVSTQDFESFIRPIRLLRHPPTRKQCLPLTLKTTISPSEIVLDYGRCEGGLPTFNIASSSFAKTGVVEFDVIYSETLEGVDHEDGDGPCFLFSNAMNTYRRESYSYNRASRGQIVAQFAQQSQRYQKIILKTPNASLTFSSVGFRQLRQPTQRVCSFISSDVTLNAIYQTGARTVELCTVAAGETLEAWQVTEEGTRVPGQHWAPCRQGTRWGDKYVTFEVLIEQGGMSFGIHMVANGLIFRLDAKTRILEAFEGLADRKSVFPATHKGSWQLPASIDLHGWLSVAVKAVGKEVSIIINEDSICTLIDLSVHPMLGGSGNNTGSIAFGGPSGYSSIYRNLHVQTLEGKTLYKNAMQRADKRRTQADFQVGTNEVAATIDGAKRDRAVFGGDLYVMGRSIYYSTGRIEAVLGSIQLLTSHQTSEGYLGNLCPIQTPLHDSSEEPPTYAFYSLSYALLLVVAIKDYWMYTGDRKAVNQLFDKLEKLMSFTGRFVDKRGLVVAPPPLSMDWFPMGGPIFGASGKINLAYYEALSSMALLSIDATTKDIYESQASALKLSIQTHLVDSKNAVTRMSDSAPSSGLCQDVAAYGITTGIAAHPDPQSIFVSSLTSKGLPLAFTAIPGWDKIQISSPYASGFAIESLFSSSQGHAAIDLMKRVWGPMANSLSTNYSGAHWEAMKVDGSPFMHDMSLAHGWSTWPTFLLPQYLAGLKPLEAGWKRFEISPVLAGVDSVDVELDIPVGRVVVSLRVKETEWKGELRLNVPFGSVAEVRAPKGWKIEGSSEMQEIVGDNSDIIMCIRRR